LASPRGEEPPPRQLRQRAAAHALSFPGNVAWVCHPLSSMMKLGLKQSKLNKRSKIPIRMQQGHPVLDAPCGDEAVNCLANSDASLTQLPIVYCALARDGFSHERNYEARRQGVFYPRYILIRTDALQYLGQNEVPNDQFLLPDKLPEPVHFGSSAPAKKVDPDGSIN
jgi:hypothetical protein